MWRKLLVCPNAAEIEPRNREDFLNTLKRCAAQVFLVLLLASLLLAQTSSQEAQPTGTPDHGTTAQTPEQKISPQEADELFHEVDRILKFASKDTDLPIKHEVKRRLTSREELTAYMAKHMSDDEDTKRLRRSELVLKKFGLIPRDFDLGKFLVALLREQVAGYYDPKTKTVNLLDWVGIEQQRPVLAHELTHALQDQSFGLDKWMKAGAGDLAERKKEPSPEDIENDEMSTARQAVVEGQAMAVLIDYMLQPSGQTILNAPGVVDALNKSMMAGTPDSVEFRSAPIYLREALTFPYRYGLTFEVALLRKGGKDRAFAGVFTDPPRTTRQIMEPQTYLSGENIPPLPLPDFKQIFKKYNRFDVGAIGEFDVDVLIDQYAGEEAAHWLYPSWRGGYYYAVEPKGNSSAPLGLLYVSRWSSAQKAQEFAAIYAKALSKRYQHLSALPNAEKDPLDDPATLETLAGKHAWQTEDGPVVMDQEGDTLLITESLDSATTDELEQAVFAVPAGAAK
jgi:hypothetical protein